MRGKPEDGRMLGKGSRERNQELGWGLDKEGLEREESRGTAPGTGAVLSCSSLKCQTWN